MSFVLAQQGLKDELVDRFTGDAIQIAADKQNQYEMLSNRKNLVQTNHSLLNELFDQLNEILSTGKTLYKNKFYYPVAKHLNLQSV